MIDRRTRRPVLRQPIYRHAVGISRLFAALRQILPGPLPFFAAIASSLVISAIVLAVPIVITFMQTGLVPRSPTAVLATGMVILAFLSLASGLVLDTVTRGRKEMKRLHYLSIPK